MSWIAAALYWSGLVHLALLLRRRILRRRGVYILSYHHVIAAGGNHQNSPRDATPVTWFERHLTFLMKHFTLVSLEAALRILGNGPVTKDYAVITFDDGYKDNYEQAFPLLQRYGVAATTFLIAGLIGTSRIPWYDAVSLQPDKAVQVHARAPFALLTWNDVRQMASHRMSFGSHSMHHPVLTAIRADEAMQELETSRALITQRLGRDCQFFAFPNGEFTPTMTELLRRAGYACACTQDYGVNRPGCDVFTLRRVAVGRTPTAMLALKLTGIPAPLYAARRWLRARSQPQRMRAAEHPLRGALRVTS